MSEENKEIIEDYLKVDKELPGQNYVCLSFVSPNKVLKRKETFYVHKYLQARAEKYGLTESEVTEDFDNFLYNCFAKVFVSAQIPIVIGK